jgi:hypothetical protein
MSLAAIRDQALQIALSQDGVREQGGANRGPEVERYLASVGLSPGQPWCCAFVYWCYLEACLRAGGENPLPRTGKCAHLWRLASPLWLSSQPSRGAIFVHLVEPDDPESDGHVGLVTAFTDRTVQAIEGNTNAAGSRIGDRVRLNLRPRAYIHGYIDIGRQGPVDLPKVA